MEKPWKTIKSLYEIPLAARRTGPLYNAFSYPTKISPEVIAIFIATHTKPGDSVLDTFGGSGTTGLATLLCDKPTETMLSMAEELGLAPTWGPRTAHLYEVGTIGAFVSKTLCSPPDPNKFAKAVKELRLKAENKAGWIYKAESSNGEDGFIRHVIWSEVLVCPECSEEKSYWSSAVNLSPLFLTDTFNCDCCNYSCKINKCERSTETAKDDFGGNVIRRKRVPIRVYGTSGKKRWMREPTDRDLELLDKINNINLPENAPDKDIVWGDLYRAGYHKGISKLHHFYTRRNFYAVATLWELIEDFDDDLKDALRLLILSYNASHSTLMSRVVVKKGQNDLVLTGAQSGVLYISGLPVEKNVFEGISRKAKSLTDAFRLVHDTNSKVLVHNSSSEVMNIKSSSIDYIFTNPPFGAYIPYAEVNQLNEHWLGITTPREREIIVSRAQGKSVNEYGEMMGSVFKEMSRVLKSNGLATVVFHSAHSEIWRVLASSYIEAGFSVQATSVLDKIQSSFKQVVSNVTVKGDPLLLLSKEERLVKHSHSECSLADKIIQDSANLTKEEKTNERLYSRFIGSCLELGIDITLDARDFYARVERIAGVNSEPK